MGHEKQQQTQPMSEEEKRTPGAWQGNKPGDEVTGAQQPSTTSEPAYGGSQGQQLPPQGGEQRPDDAQESGYRPGTERDKSRPDVGDGSPQAPAGGNPDTTQR